jgi:hypothetical protein
MPVGLTCVYAVLLVGAEEGVDCLGEAQRT